MGADGALRMQWTRGTCRSEHRPRPPGGERSRFVGRSKQM
ncbi:hypothetical protein XOCgx_1922 [Xanthomonas oryzae pv. oryzicola]|nr:hypothetical protein XOCgx_1922 [Xanthomonas oryzae pv. oryzicola]